MEQEKTQSSAGFLRVRLVLTISRRTVLSSHGHRRDMLNCAQIVWPSLIWIVIKQVMHHSVSSSEISSSNKHSSTSSKMSTQELTSNLSELKSSMSEMKTSLSSHLVAAAAAAAQTSGAKFTSAGLLQGNYSYSKLCRRQLTNELFNILLQVHWKD